MTQPTFTFMGDEEIWDIIGGAREKVIFAAPSFSAKIANAFLINAELKEKFRSGSLLTRTPRLSGSALASSRV